MADDTGSPDLATAAIQAAIGWITSFNYQSIGTPCPACHHAPVMQRHVGFIIGGHHQQSCPCRLVREAGQQTPCGCEWTNDF